MAAVYLFSLYGRNEGGGHGGSTQKRKETWVRRIPSRTHAQWLFSYYCYVPTVLHFTVFGCLSTPLVNLISVSSDKLHLRKLPSHNDPHHVTATTIGWSFFDIFSFFCFCIIYAFLDNSFSVPSFFNNLSFFFPFFFSFFFMNFLSIPFLSIWF